MRLIEAISKKSLHYRFMEATGLWRVRRWYFRRFQLERMKLKMFGDLARPAYKAAPPCKRKGNEGTGPVR